MAVLFLLICAVTESWSESVASLKQTGGCLKVVIDPGHGGSDPGKVAGDGTLEKDLNLQIAKRLGTYLEKKGMQVYFTRESDCSLCQETAGSKKAKDLQKRCQIVENIQPDVTISIHQNSYTDSSVHGAQVFYYETSEKSRLLGEAIQQKLVTVADPSNHREAKANTSYYILRKTVSPTVIVECGFLSNPEESQKLSQEKYQEKLVESIYQGILDYAKTQRQE